MGTYVDAAQRSYVLGTRNQYEGLERHATAGADGAVSGGPQGSGVAGYLRGQGPGQDGSLELLSSIEFLS